MATRKKKLIKYKAKEAGIEVVADIFEVRKTAEKYLKVKKREHKELTQAERGYRGLLKDKILNKLFNADLVGAYNIARVGKNSPRLIKNLKLLFIKLCNPVKYISL